MPLPLERAATALQKAMAKVSGATVIYSRAGQSTEPITAVRARSTFESDDEAAGARIEARSQDFIVIAAELQINNQTIVPLEGDTIAWTCDGVTETYEVMVPPYSPSDSVGVRLRIHTKRVS